MAGKYTSTSRSTFAADVEAWALDSKEVMENVMRQSINDAVHMAQRPSKQGGKMPVRTGFLRSSGMGSLNGWPTGPDERPGDGPFAWDGESITTTLAGMEIGDTFFFGWTAVYALRQETYNGFMESTQQKWQNIVNVNVGRLKR